MLACRLCRVPLNAPLETECCPVCKPIRPNLVVVGEDEEEAPSLAGVGNESLNAVRDQIRYHKGILKTNPGNGKVEQKLVSCINALAKLTGEVRKLQDDAHKTVAAMSFAERLEMFIDWIFTLPPAYRTALLERVDQAEKTLAMPAPADVPTRALPSGN